MRALGKVSSLGSEYHGEIEVSSEVYSGWHSKEEDRSQEQREWCGERALRARFGFVVCSKNRILKGKS